MGAFNHQEWIYNGAFEQLFGLGRGEFEQKVSKNSNAWGVAQGGLPGGMFKLRFDRYVYITYTIGNNTVDGIRDMQRYPQRSIPLSLSWDRRMEGILEISL